MRKASLLVPVLLLATAASCGSNNGTGFYASGALHSTVHDVTNGDADLVFQFDSNTRIDPTLPSSQVSGTTGVCSVGPTGRSLRLTNVANGSPVFQLDVQMPPWDQDTCVNCQHGQIVLTEGATVWTGVENRGTTTGASQCTFTTTQDASFDMHLTVSCAALAASGSDTRTVTVSGTVALRECDGPSTGG